MSIKVSPKHGVNPTIPHCFWCGKPKNEIALLGKLPGDKQAPMNMVLDYDPCDMCKNNMALGVTLMEVTTIPETDGRPPIQLKPVCVYPTGRWVVITVESADRLFPEHAPFKKRGKLFLEDAVFSHFVVDDPSPDITEQG